MTSCARPRAPAPSRRASDRRNRQRRHRLLPLRARVGWQSLLSGLRRGLLIAKAAGGNFHGILRRCIRTECCRREACTNSSKACPYQVRAASGDVGHGSWDNGEGVRPAGAEGGGISPPSLASWVPKGHVTQHAASAVAPCDGYHQDGRSVVVSSFPFPLSQTTAARWRLCLASFVYGDASVEDAAPAATERTVAAARQTPWPGLRL